MKKHVLCYVLASIIISCTPIQKQQNETLQANVYNLVDEQNLNWKALNPYAGKYSKILVISILFY
jgi:hypothetical protein